jgi:hypothetical protein
MCKNLSPQFGQCIYNRTTGKKRAFVLHM